MKFTGLNSFISFVNALVGGGLTPTNFRVSEIYRDFKEKRLIISHLQCSFSCDETKTLTISFYNAYGENVLNYILKG